jgi:predicted PurR-regulated permease PerM
MITRERPAAARTSDDDWRSAARLPTLFLLLLTVLGIVVCYQLAAPFLPALAFAAALAVLFVSLQVWLESKIRNTSVAAIVAVVVIGTIVIVPATFVAQQLVVQASQSAKVVEAKIKSGEWRRTLSAQPQLAPIVDAIEQRVDLQGTAKSLATWLSTTAGSIVKGSLVQLVGFCLIFYLLFFLLRDRQLVLHALKALSPLTDAEMDHLFTRVADTVYATVYGTLAVSCVQGLLGGLMFWWLGLSAPLLWGVVMALLAVVPVLGAFVVWVPAAIYLALEGNWGQALILSAWGMLVVGTIDNLLRPILVGNRLDLHTVLAFISIVGGLVLFGPAGLILGPVALAVTLVLIDGWRWRQVR